MDDGRDDEPKKRVLKPPGRVTQKKPSKPMKRKRDEDEEEEEEEDAGDAEDYGEEDEKDHEIEVDNLDDEEDEGDEGKGCGGQAMRGAGDEAGPSSSFKKPEVKKKAGRPKGASRKVAAPSSISAADYVKEPLSLRRSTMAKSNEAHQERQAKEQVRLPCHPLFIMHMHNIRTTCSVQWWVGRRMRPPVPHRHHLSRENKRLQG